MNPVLQSKLPKVGTTIFTEMSVLANRYSAINLGQGFPDFMMSEKLISLVDKAMLDGHNQYVHMNGWPALRERLAEKFSKLYGANLHPETDITITPGGTYAIYTALTTVLRPGDEVIVFEPSYDSYIPNIEINGAVPVLIPLQAPDFSIDWQMVKEKITSKTRMIMLNSPHNPTGSILRKPDIDALTKLVRETGIFILSDEVYEHLVFDNQPHESILKYPELMQRSFVCFSFGKTYHCTGWKLGYCVAPSILMNEFRKVHQFNCFSCNSPLQVALAEYLQEEEAYLSLGSVVQQKRDYFQKLMLQTRLEPLPTYGSYFQLYSYAGISEEKEKEFAIRLTREFGVATIPLSAFYQEPSEHKLIRFCFVKKEITLEAAANRLIKL